LVKTVDITGSERRHRQRDNPTPLNELEECGIGMELQSDDSLDWYVAGVRPGGPAACSGILQGDLLRAVDWKPIKGKCEYEVQRLIYGRKGTAVTLEFAGETARGSKHVTLLRGSDYTAVREQAADRGEVESQHEASDKACCSMRWDQCIAPRCSDRRKPATART
jgi:C-terminal processing protease CtpA/Prc